MYRELGLLLVLLLGASLIYLVRHDASQLSGKSKKKKKNKKKNKKATTVTTTSDDIINASVDDNLINSTSSPSSNALPSFIMRRYQRPATEPSTSPTSDDSLTEQHATTEDTTIAPSKHQKEGTTRNRHYSTKTQKHTPSRPSKKVDFPPLIAPSPMDTSSKETKEADINYSRVLRIRSEPASPSKMNLGQTRMQHQDVPLTKKQRENQVRTAKRKELKAQADALQEERLRQHQRQLTGHSIGAKSKKKNTEAISSRRPTGKASLNEFGQLVWD